MNSSGKTRTWIEEIADMVTRVTGVQFGDKRDVMLEARLHRRMMQLGIRTPSEYLQYVRKHSRTELNELISILTSHHTFFFREFRQFQFLADHVLPQILPIIQARADRTLRVWSAACSHGQEVYSLAMFLRKHLRDRGVDVNIDVKGSDVDASSVAHSRNGVYEWRQVQEVPLLYVEENWTRGTGEIRNYARVKDSLRKFCRFEVENLLQLPRIEKEEKFDVIFCRNVLIYFQPRQVRQVASSLIERLHPHGYLFIGGSESLLPFDLSLHSIAPSVYAMSAGAEASLSGAAPMREEKKTSTRSRVLCVDDSPTVLRLLKRILEPDFEVVGTAGNGIEAAQQIARLKPDLVTLDIHMPVQTGIEFLENAKDLPPVVILSSVSREDSQIALRCLELGARDYIEKPDMLSLEFRVDEIRAKLRSALQAPPPKLNTFDRSPSRLGRTKVVPQDELWLFVASVADHESLEAVIRELGANRAPIAILIEGAAGILPALAKSMTDKLQVPVELREGAILPIAPGGIALLDGEALRGSLGWAQGFRSTAVLYFSVPNQKQVAGLLRLPNPRLLIEERHFGRVGDATKWHDRVRFIPATSFAYHLIENDGQKVSNG